MKIDNENQIASPITHLHNVDLWDEIPGSKIIETYRKQLSMDVSSLIPIDKTIKIGRCRDSSFRFYWPPNIVGDESFYQALELSHQHSSSMRWEHRRALNLIKKNMKVLEVGCGPGVFLSNLKQKEIEAMGLELNSKIAEKARTKGHKVEIDSLESHSKKHTGYYDAVCFFQVLEHVADVKSFLDAALLSLNTGGLLIMGVPNNNPWLFKYDRMHTLNLPPHHMGLWDKEALQLLPMHFNMEMVMIEVEPMIQVKKHIKALLEHKNLIGLSNISIKLPNIVERILSRTLGFFIDGRNLFAVYKKL